jgi:hypothetical protein
LPPKSSEPELGGKPPFFSEGTSLGKELFFGSFGAGFVG